MLSNTPNNEENVSLIVQFGTTNVGCTHDSIAVSTIDNCQRSIVSITDAESQLLVPGDNKSSRSVVVKEENYASSPAAVTSTVLQQIIEVDHFKPLNEISNVAPPTAANLKFKTSQDLKGNHSILNAAAVNTKHKQCFSDMNSTFVMQNELSNLKRKGITDTSNGSRMKLSDQSLNCKPRPMMHVPIQNQFSVNSKQKLAGDMNMVAVSDQHLGMKQRFNVEYSNPEGMNVKHVYYNRQSSHVTNSHSKPVSSHMPPPKWHNNQVLSSGKQSSKGSSRSHFKSYGGVSKSYATNYPFTNYLQQPKHRVITFNMVKTIPTSRIKACQWRFNDDDLLDGTIEKRPRFHKHLPLNFQYVLQDHNYGAPPPLSPQLPSPVKPSLGLNGIPVSNSQNRSVALSHPTVITASYKAPMGSTSNSKQVLNGNLSPRHRPMPQSQVATLPSTLTFNHSSVLTVNKTEESELSSDEDREPELEGEETETAPEAEDNEDDSVTRCICDFQHDDGYMICCDRCNVWQHVECMGLTRENIPEEYQCERCQPRPVNKQRAISLQQKKRKQLFNDTTDSDSSISSSSTPVKNPLAKGLLSNMKHVSRVPGRKKLVVTARRKKEKIVRHPKQRRSYTLTKRSKRESLGSKDPGIAATLHTEKKVTTRRKSGGRVSLDSEKSPGGGSESSLNSPVERSSVQQLRQWIDSYEEAVTNHYSPELRARILAIKVNGIHSDLKLPSNLPAVPKCRVSLQPSGLKILMSSTHLPSNQPLMELRGKYMLVSPPLMGKQLSRTSSTPPPGPHIFHYRLPKDGTEVCVDARTYGNDARFIRRSCKPNVEIRHCIEKGTLHLYLVTICAIEKNTEIFLPNLPDTPNLDCPCGGKCPTKPIVHATKKNGIIVRKNTPSPPPPKERISVPVAGEAQSEEPSVTRRSLSKDERKKRQNSASNITQQATPKNDIVKRRGRRRTVSDSGKVVVPVEKPQPIPEKVPERPRTPVEIPERTSSSDRDRERDKDSDRERSSLLTRRKSVAHLRTTRVSEQKKEKESPKEESAGSPSAQTPTKCDQSLADSLSGTDPSKMTREERKLAAILKAFDRLEKDQTRKRESHGKGSTRKDSSDSPAVVVESPAPAPIPKPPVQSLVPSIKSSPKRKKGKRRILSRTLSNSQPSPRTRRALQRRQKVQQSQSETSSDEEDLPSKPTTRHGSSRHMLSPEKNHPTTPIKNESGSSSDTPGTPISVSNTCLLVAAAVGPLAPGFKFPQTKKPSLNSWAKTQDSTAGDESPSKNTPQGNGANGNGPGFAKKRWLRQAISEESETPAGGSLLTDQCAGPLKKRRLARESMSSEQSFTPPTTPTHNASSSLPGFDEDSRMSAHEEANNDQGANSCDSTMNEDMDLSPELIKRNLSPELIQRDKNAAEVKEEPFGDEEEDIPERLNTASPELIKREPERKVEPEPEKMEMKLIDRVEQELSNLMGFTDTKPLLFNLEPKKEKKEETVEEEEEPPVVPEVTTPAAVRKKLSISEYRQRKGGGPPVKQTSDKDEEEATVPHSPSSSSSSPPTFPDVEDASAIIAKSLELESTIAQQLDSSKGGKNRFVASSTLVEKQRENLTERLKREFGLILDDDEEQEKNRKKNLMDEELERNRSKVLNDQPPALPKLKEPIVSMAVPSNFVPGPVKKTKHGSQPPPPPPSEPPPLYQPFYYPYSHFPPPLPRHPH